MLAKLAVTTSMVAMLGAGTASAQDGVTASSPSGVNTALVPAPTENASADGPSASAEIVVTALKRSQSVQRTPATVEVVSSDELQTAAINTIEQLGSVAPGVIIQRPPNNTANASIRGIGTAPGPVSFDQAVAMFVDGVYAARGADFLSSLFDIESIQVVKGSQAAVLGKNTSLGAIVLTTRKPGDRLGINVLSSHEFERNSTVISGGIDVPVAPDLAVRVAGQFQDLGGFMRNRVTAPPAERRARETDEWAVRGTAAWAPGNGVDATLSYAHEFLRNRGTPAEIVVGSPGLQTLFALAGYAAVYETVQDNRHAIRNVDGPTRLRQQSDRAVGTVNVDLGGPTLTSVSGWSQFRQSRYIDNDFTPGTYYADDTRIAGEQFNQELRLSSLPSDRLTYLAGLLFVDNRLTQDQIQRTTFPGGIAGPVPVAGAYSAGFDQKTTTWSGFLQLGYELVDRLTLTGAARLTNERKSVAMQRTTLVQGRFSQIVNPPYSLTRLRRSETVIDGSIAAQYQLTPRAMVYASFGQGTKGGGFSDFPLPADAEYRKEVARTVEAGFKLDGDDRSWRVNGALFHTAVSDFQNNFFNGQVFVVQNLDLESNGAELEAFWSPVANLEFNLSGTYAKSRNKEATPGVGDRFPRSPRLSGKVGFDYQAAVADGADGYVGADVTYRSLISHQINPVAVPYGRPFPTINGVLGLRHADRAWDLALIWRNLFNRRSLSFASPVPFTPGAVLGIPEEPRTVTLQATFRL